MALPPKGDPRRPLFLAASSCNVLGGLLALITLLVLAVAILVGSQGGSAMMLSIVFMIIMGVYGAFAVLLFVTGYHLKREKRWAIVLGLVLASVMLAFSLISLVSPLVLLVSSSSSNNAGACAQLAITAIFVAAFAQMIWHLIQGRKYLNERDVRGFEMLPAAQVVVPVADIAPQPVVPLTSAAPPSDDTH